MRIRPKQKTTKLGTDLRFEISRNPTDVLQGRPDTKRVVFLVKVRNVLYRLAPDNLHDYSGPWRLDLKVGCWPWEAVTPETFATPELAAKDLQTRVN